MCPPVRDSRTRGRPANNGANTVAIYLGNGNGAFSGRVGYTVGTNPRAVAIGDVNQAVGQETATALGSQASFATVDVSDRASVQSWVDEVLDRHGRIDVLVNNAGITRDAQLVKVKDGDVVGQMSEADFDLVVGINLKGWTGTSARPTTWRPRPA